MQLDYHYYLVYHLAKLAGFPTTNAETIAYASQYVDDATEGEPIRPYGDKYFDPIRTAHYGLWAFDWDVQKKIYIPFHFLPPQVFAGDSARFSYVTKHAAGASSEPATRLVEAALTEQDPQLWLIRLGIALHAIADTFSHFGFSGRHDNENDVEQIQVVGKKRLQLQNIFWEYVYRYGDIVFPRIGHAEAFYLPDLPYAKWSYRDHAGTKRPRTNLDDCIQGAEFIYGLLCIARHPPGDAATLRNDLASLAGSSRLSKEQPRERDAIIRLFKSQANEDVRCVGWKEMTRARAYDKFRWRSDAVSGDVKWDKKSHSGLKSHLMSLVAKKGFEQSKWVGFHRAARAQRALVTSWLN